MGAVSCGPGLLLRHGESPIAHSHRNRAPHQHPEIAFPCHPLSPHAAFPCGKPAVARRRANFGRIQASAKKALERDVEVGNTSTAEPGPRLRRPQRRALRLAIWAGGIILLLAVTAGIYIASYLHRAEPILRERVIQTLAATYDCRVQLAAFNVSVAHGFQAEGTGLKLYPNHIPAKQPLFSVRRFTFRIPWFDLLRTPMHVDKVHINGLSIHLPPKGERAAVSRLNRKANHGASIIVDHLVVDHASLILLTNKPGKVPLDFEIINLRITSVGAGKPMHFRAILVNPKPIGNIDSTASLGPFNTLNPGDTPVSGTYRFTHADLGTLAGIGGTLSSTGRYSGTLNNIVVDGETDTPDFSLTIAAKPLPLHTTFHAIVDGTNGDTRLEPVDAMLAHSHIVARGEVTNVPNQGHHIVLNVSVGSARIEDLLILAVKQAPPLMRGSLVLHARLDLPPGNQPVTDRLRLENGTFRIRNVHFSNPAIQKKVDQLSLRSQGHAKKAEQITAGNNLPKTASQMQGSFALANGQLTLTHMLYTVPGASVAMHGFYSLNGGQLGFDGTARLNATVSQMVTGWKSLLLKPVDPFFSKNGAGTVVPIRITGTRSDPKFQLNFFGNGKAAAANKNSPTP